MSYVCPVCAENPQNHSFMRLEDASGVAIFYSCPGKAIKYKSDEGIIEHMDGMLRELDGKPWKWIVDGAGFSMKHASQVNLAISIMRLINNHHGSSLRQICIINPSKYIHAMLAVIWPFMTEYMRSIIVMRN
jgi:hypothetical protein